MEVTTTRRPMARITQAVARRPRTSAILGVVLIVASLWVWWFTQLWGLPDIGDPFDVVAFQAQRIPDERNAFVEYRDAAAMTTASLRKIRNGPDGKSIGNQFPQKWSEASPGWRALLADSREAIDLWRTGSEKPEALYEHPEGLTMRTLLPVTQELRMLGRLAVLEGSRLEDQGDVASAWGWYRAALRSSRHSGWHGFLIERLVGGAMHDEASKALTRWAADPRVDGPMLRRALDEVIAIDTMTVPRSETIKQQYLLFVNALDDPNLIDDVLVSKMYTDEPGDWCQELPLSDATKKPIQAARVMLASDRDRSLRLARLMTANWLAEVDKPPSRRSKLARKDPPIYEADPAAAASSRVLSPEKLSKWLDSSLLALRHFRGVSRYAPALDREWSRQARLVVHLASELYRREHGQPPPTPQTLVGPYLKALPEGFDAIDEPVKTGP